MPADPRLMALPALRKLAEEEARDIWTRHVRLFALHLPDMQTVADPHDASDGFFVTVEAQVERLADLSRPASRDAVARMMAEAVGLTCGATAPAFYWTAEAHDSTDNDGAPNGDGWPAGWWLSDNVGNLVFFTSADWCPGDFTMIADLPDGEGSVVRAFTLIALAVLGAPDAP